VATHGADVRLIFRAGYAATHGADVRLIFRAGYAAANGADVQLTQQRRVTFDELA
jgi:hypothetical protein